MTAATLGWRGNAPNVSRAGLLCLGSWGPRTDQGFFFAATNRREFLLRISPTPNPIVGPSPVQSSRPTPALPPCLSRKTITPGTLAISEPLRPCRLSRLSRLTRIPCSACTAELRTMAGPPAARSSLVPRHHCVCRPRGVRMPRCARRRSRLSAAGPAASS